MAHEGDDTGIAVDAYAAGFTGAAHFAQHQTGALVARLYAAARELFPRTAKLRFPLRCEGQPELFYLADKVVIDRQAVFRVLPECGVPDRGKILVIQQQRHAAPPLSKTSPLCFGPQIIFELVSRSTHQYNSTSCSKKSINLQWKNPSASKKLCGISIRITIFLKKSPVSFSDCVSAFSFCSVSIWYAD